MKNEATIDGITVGGQPSAEELTSGRFASVINVRGNDEAGNATASVLAGTGVAYTPVPWTIDTVTADDIARIGRAVDAAKGPILLHCMAGTRAAMAAAIVSAERDGSGESGALDKVAKAGFTIDGTPYAAFVHTYFEAHE